MPRPSPYVVELTKAERNELAARARKYTSPYRDVIRAKIVLLAAQGLANDLIASRLDTARQIVSKWRKRFCLARLPGLEEAPRGGRPARFSPSVRVEVKALACELPARRGFPVARWSLPELRCAVIAQGIVAQISGATLWHWLSQDTLRVAAPEVDLPARPGVRAQGRPHPRPLRTSLAGPAPGPARLCGVRRREDEHSRPAPKHPTLPPAPGRVMRVEHEYARAGAWPTSPPGMCIARRCSAGARQRQASRPSSGSSDR
jgi:transposase